MKILLLLFLSLLGGCFSSQALNVETIYRKDMLIKVDDVNFYGAKVLDKKPSYDIKVYFFKKPTKFILASCHRHMVWNNPGDGISYIYTPDPQLEQNEDKLCPVEFGAFDAEGQSAWGYIDFRSTETMPAKLSCNGTLNVSAVGVSLCQSKTHLVQRITFEQPTYVVGTKSCPEPESDDRQTFFIEMGRGKCFYLFQAGNIFHRLTMLGYDDVILR